MRLKVSLSVLEVFGFQKSFGFWRLGSCLFFFLLGVTRFPLLGCGTRWAVYFVPFKIKLAAAIAFLFFCLYSQKMNYGFGSNTQISRFGCSFGAAVLVILMFGQVVILGSQQLELKVQVCFNVTHKKISRIQDQTTISSK